MSSAGIWIRRNWKYMAMTRRKLIITGIVVLALVTILWQMTRRGGGTGELVVRAERRPFKAELLQIGLVQAVNSTNITPRSRGKIADLVEEGAVVVQDEPIAWLETEELERDVEKYRVDLELAKKRLKKAEENARLQNQLNELSVQESQSNYQYRRNQLASARADLEKTRRLVDAGISPRKALDDRELDVLSQELQMQNAKLALEKAINNRDSQAELQKADVNAARIDVEKSRSELKRVEENLQNAVIRAPTSGMVLYKRVWKGGGMEKVAVGDQVGPWHPFLEIPDLSLLEIVTKVDEIDISRLAENQSATITLDAFPEMKLTGQVTKVAALAQDAESPGESMGRGGGNASGRKVFEVHISIDEAPDELRPGVTGRVRILLAEEDDALVVPVESVFSDSDGRFVYVDTFGGPERRAVETGVWNHQYITLTDGLKAGEKVWLVRPE